ncbi:hypothetical protein [Spirosoma oryzicola]|uniref:hypothetical protein n=1 Tax=Spirosoma oryzicola TaxID=2898794 RepID=UPI001E54D88C|nr:hypothetical protein [Spirosoma oryzicola]UHG93295.1 hypothetical protein LQ777_10420 [Spirosoma oryzicola]
MAYVMPINRTPQKQYAIGIDPDVKKNGVALYCRIAKRILELSLKDFDATIAYISGFDLATVTVYVDAGWRNRNPQYHDVKIPDRLKEHPEAAARYLLGVSNRIANDVGRNAATGQLICEQLRKAGYEVVEVKPTSAKWKPADMKQFTGIDTKNQEKIDAARLCFGR